MPLQFHWTHCKMQSHIWLITDPTSTLNNTDFRKESWQWNGSHFSARSFWSPWKMGRSLSPFTLVLPSLCCIWDGEHLGVNICLTVLRKAVVTQTELYKCRKIENHNTFCPPVCPTATDSTPPSIFYMHANGNKKVFSTGCWNAPHIAESVLHTRKRSITYSKEL